MKKLKVLELDKKRYIVSKKKAETFQVEKKNPQIYDILKRKLEYLDDYEK